MNVNVDEDLCQGTGFCQRLVAEVFEVRDDDQAHVLAFDEEDVDLQRLREAEEMCPTGAIRIEP